MLKKAKQKQFAIEMVQLEQLVPDDHLLRKIDRYIDFEFISDKVSHLYCPDNGRPALDPVMLFKIIFLGYLFGVRSERQLMREIEVNLAYRWFLGLSLTDTIPDASTLSQNRRRRFTGTDVYQQIFDEIVEQAVKAGLVGGKLLFTDSTHLKASANKTKHDLVEVALTPVEYLQALEADITADRTKRGKRPLKDKDDDDTPPSKQKKISRTDPDSGYMVRDGKPKGFFYLDHRTVDGKHAIITDSYATHAALHDSRPYLQRLDRQRARFGFDVSAVGLDAGYSTTAICKGLVERGIEGLIGYRRPNKPKGMMPKRLYKYDQQQDVYICPEGQWLAYATTDRNGYRHYRSDPAHCRLCARLQSCTRNSKAQKSVTRHIWQGYKEQVDRNRLTLWGKHLYRRRAETVERSFADAKQLHGHRYARMRGINKVKEQCLMAATAQNMKKIALLLHRKTLYCLFRPRKDKISPLKAFNRFIMATCEKSTLQSHNTCEMIA